MTHDAINNEPGLWQELLPRPTIDGHKYDRGSALILGAPDLTGASRLAAEACSRIGAGMVKVLAAERGDVYRATLAADIMVTNDVIGPHPKATALLIGPGGLPSSWHEAISAIDRDATLVVDADGLAHIDVVAPLEHPKVLTPHEGEFARAFPQLTGSRERRCLAAAETTSCVIVLKGAETLIGDPNGRLVRNQHASPYLAKAGSGDVLAGLITGLVAQRMPPFEAACAAVWMHGDAARRIGPGLIASDLIDEMKPVLAELLS